MARSKARRRAAILMLVLVVLAVAGMLGLQAVQSLVLIRSAESRRMRMLQSKEVLDFARQAAIAKGGMFEKTEISVGDQRAEISIQAKSSDEDSDANTRKVDGERRIIVRYPLGQASELKTSYPLSVDPMELDEKSRFAPAEAADDPASEEKTGD